MLSYGYMDVLGFPLLVWLGLLSLLLAFAAASAGIAGVKMPMKRHRMLAMASIILALIHAMMAMSAYF